MGARVWARDLGLALSTSVRMATTEPAHFAVQVARRFAPLWLRRTEPRSSRASQWRALRWFLMDLPERARADLEVIGYRGHVAQELAALLADVEPSELRGAAAARAWLSRGEFTKALACVPESHRLARRIASELRVYSRGFRLRSSPRRVVTPAGGGPRVLFILTNSKPWTQSGYTARTHSILKTLIAAGVQVLAVTRIGYPVTIGHLGQPLSQVIDGVEYRRLPTHRLPVEVDHRLQAQVEMLTPIVEEFRPTVLHTTTDLTNAVVTRALADRFGLPWVYELRGQLELSWVASRPESLREAAATSERVRLWRDRDAELATSADRVVVLSGVQRDEMIARGVCPERIIVVPNSVDDAVLQRAPISPADARQRLGLPREGTWVGSVTSVVDYEGLDLLLDAVAQARAQGYDIRCAIVGDGVSRPGLIAQARELGFGDDVCVMPGRVPADKALEWYEALDVFAVPRRDTPVCRVVTPLKPLNALALGRPILVSDLPALRTLVDAFGDWVRVVSPGANAWASVIREMLVRETPGVPKRSWSVVLSSLIEWYSSPD